MHIQIHFCKYAHNCTFVYFVDMYICVLFMLYICELYACIYYNHKYPLPYTYPELVFTDKNKLTLSYSFFDTRQDYGMIDVQIHKLKNGIFRTIPQLYQKYGILTQKKRERFFRMKER